MALRMAGDDSLHGRSDAHAGSRLEWPLKPESGWGRWYRTKSRAGSFLGTGRRARESGGGADGLQNCSEEPKSLLRCRLWRVQEERKRLDLKHTWSFYLLCCSLSGRRSNRLSTWEPLASSKGVQSFW